MRRMILSGLILVILSAELFAITYYRAVCTEKAEHGGKEVELGDWRPSMTQANRDGKAHELFTRGHRWRIATVSN